jgi:hypothetical protein
MSTFQVLNTSKSVKLQGQSQVFLTNGFDFVTLNLVFELLIFNFKFGYDCSLWQIFFTWLIIIFRHITSVMEQGDLTLSS